MTKAQTVLVIEDDPWFAGQHIRMLQAAGFACEHASNGVEGIKALDRAVPDAVVLDLFLPGPNGLALLHEMKSYTDLSRLPVIVCTSSTSRISSERLAPYGVVALIDKGTMGPDDVVKAVRRVLV